MPNPPPSFKDPSLGGRTIALLESRRAKEIAELVHRYDGVPWSVPAMREAPLDDRSESVQRLKQLCADGTEVMICLTGVGTRALFELAAELGLEERLRAVFDAAIVVIRGPKPRVVLRELGVRIDRTAEPPNTSDEVLAALAGDRFQKVAVQLYGEPDALLRAGLEARGAQVLDLPLYRWALPDDVLPIVDFIDRISLHPLWQSQARARCEICSRLPRQQSGAATRRGPSSLDLAAIGPVAAARFGRARLAYCQSNRRIVLWEPLFANWLGSIAQRLRHQDEQF